MQEQDKENGIEKEEMKMIASEESFSRKGDVKNPARWDRTTGERRLICDATLTLKKEKEEMTMYCVCTNYELQTSTYRH